MTLEELKQQALEACEFRGHKMNKWKEWDRSSYCTCSSCEMYVQVIPEPRPNEIDIGGTAVAMTCTGWSEEWPTESGYYWLYGWPFGYMRGIFKPRLNFVLVSRWKGKVTYVTNGYLVRKDKGAYGKWRRVDLPDLPELGE